MKTERVEQTELDLPETVEPVTVTVKKNKEGLKFCIDLLENIRLESIREE